MIEKIQKALVKYWGYDSFLPLQQEAMECISGGRDSIVVLPTLPAGANLFAFRLLR